MTKRFNTQGVCVPGKHYMVDLRDKLNQVIRLIEEEMYFTINRPRQYGKTTMLSAIKRRLLQMEGYLPLSISLEGIGEERYVNAAQFSEALLGQVQMYLEVIHKEAMIEFIDQYGAVSNFDQLNRMIGKFTATFKDKIVLIIDEVDKSCNNQLFLDFLGMLRNKYLQRSEGEGTTFHSVILAGVYDVKTLKLKLRPDDGRRYNSPWNIAADFKVDLSFSAVEIASMLGEYEKDHRTGMDITAISNEIYRYSGGYPFLVSKLCQIIDEELNRDWSVTGVAEAAKRLVKEKNTLFDDLFKNLENQPELYELVYAILVEGKNILFNNYNPLVELGVILGLFAKTDSYIRIANRIFEMCIYNYMISKRNIEKGELVTYEYRSRFVVEDRLDMELVLNKFQEVMHDEFREKDAKFIEREGRLLFLCFLKPIINGAGFYYVEAETRMDNRMDIVVTYGRRQYIVELKIWHGENYEQNALEQLAGYLQNKRENDGYLISFNFNKNKEYTKGWKEYKGKRVYAVVV